MLEEMTKKDKEFFDRVLYGNAKIRPNHKSRSKLFKFVSSYAKSIAVDEENDAWLIHLGGDDYVVYRVAKGWVYDEGYRHTRGATYLRVLPELL